MFCAFSRLTFTNKYLNTLATACFAVYIIHMHPWMAEWAFEKFFGVKSADDHVFLVLVLVVPMITYIVCFILEQVRELIFRTCTGVARKFLAAGNK